MPRVGLEQLEVLVGEFADVLGHLSVLEAALQRRESVSTDRIGHIALTRKLKEKSVMRG